jgi:predicted transposase/invertase (TIGR01784 family)
MARYLDPRNDLPFKRIFGEHPDLLMSFLNALMPFEKHQRIESLEYLPAEQVPENPAKKNSIVDVRCKDNSGRQFIVELHLLWSNVFLTRMVFNASKACVSQFDKTQYYNLSQPVYALAILCTAFDKKTEEFYHHYRIVNYHNTEEVIAGLEFVMVELPKFKPEKMAGRQMASLWLRFLNEVREKRSSDIPDELKENAYTRRALDICEEDAFTDAELATYEKYWDFIRTEGALIATSKAEGIAKGRAEAEAKRIAERRAEGQEESLAAIVRNCERTGISVEQIQVITGLSVEKIREILA